jgi:hypothetical protein
MHPDQPPAASALGTAAYIRVAGQASAWYQKTEHTCLEASTLRMEKRPAWRWFGEQ